MCHWSLQSQLKKKNITISNRLTMKCRVWFGCSWVLNLHNFSLVLHYYVQEKKTISKLLISPNSKEEKYSSSSFWYLDYFNPSLVKILHSIFLYWDFNSKMWVIIAFFHSFQPCKKPAKKFEESNKFLVKILINIISSINPCWYKN